MNGMVCFYGCSFLIGYKNIFELLFLCLSSTSLIACMIVIK